MSKILKFQHRSGEPVANAVSEEGGSLVLRGFQVQSLAVQEPDLGRDGHPNKAPFEGVLTRVDEPSMHAPGGSGGRRILIPASVAEAALDSLLLMAVDATDRLDGHNVQQKIGVITEAWIEGQDVRVKGYLYEKDYPELVAAIRAQKQRMGMSFEGEGSVLDNAAEVLTLDALIFTGAAILYQDRAAYGNKTSLAAQAEKEKKEMDEDLKKALAAFATGMTSLAANVEKLVDLQNAQLEAAAKQEPKEKTEVAASKVPVTIDAEAVAEAVKAATAPVLQELEAQKAQLDEKTKELDEKVKAFDAAKGDVERKTVPANLTALLQKHNFEASGESKLSKIQAQQLVKDMPSLQALNTLRQLQKHNLIAD